MPISLSSITDEFDVSYHLMPSEKSLAVPILILPKSFSQLACVYTSVQRERWRPGDNALSSSRHSEN